MSNQVSFRGCRKCAAWLLVPMSVLTCLWLLTSADSIGQDPGLEEFRRMHSELRQRMDEDLDQAVVYLDAQIEKQPDSADLQVLRHSLASKLSDERRYSEAIDQYRKLLDHQIKNINEKENQYGVGMTIQSLGEVTELAKRDDALENAVDQAMKAFQTLPADQPRPWGPLSQLIVLKSHALVDSNQSDEAATAVANHLAKLESAYADQQATESTMHAYVALLKALTNSNRNNDDWREAYIEKLEEACAMAFERYPKSMRLQNDYAETQYLMITQWGQDDPDATAERIKLVFNKLSVAALSNRSVNAILRRIDVHRERMETAKPVASLVGQAAPEWDIDGWANTVGVSRKLFEGQVVLLDFWAMWCGPCIATFPHLREWREEFRDQGFEIVGVTQYYNFEWDDVEKRASRASGQVTPQQERETLSSFLEHHKLEHPVMVTPKDSEMGSKYGVRGIPHAVLIDRKGNVQLVRTGAGPDTAKEIHDKIKELLADDSKP